MKNQDDDWEEFLKQREKEKPKEEAEIKELLNHNSNNHSENKKNKSSNKQLVKNELQNHSSEPNEDKDFYNEQYDNVNKNNQLDNHTNELSDERADFLKTAKQEEQMMKADREKQRELIRRQISENKQEAHSKTKIKAIFLLAWLCFCFVLLFFGSGLKSVPTILFGFLGFMATIIILAIFTGKSTRKNLQDDIKNNLELEKPILAVVMSCVEIPQDSVDEKLYKVVLTTHEQLFYATSKKQYKRLESVKINLENKDSQNCTIVEE